LACNFFEIEGQNSFYDFFTSVAEAVHTPKYLVLRDTKTSCGII
jgi:hypothetical protein